MTTYPDEECPDMGGAPKMVNLRADSFQPVFDNWGFPVFNEDTHIRLTIEEDGLASRFVMTTEAAHGFADLIHALANGETIPREKRILVGLKSL